MKTFIMTAMLFVFTGFANASVESIDEELNCGDAGGELMVLAALPSGVACYCPGSGTLGNLQQIANRQIYCTSGGWVQNYPIANLNACPNRVNVWRPPADGCGSKLSGTHWVAQKFLWANIARDVCNPHDEAYSDCRTSKQAADDRWLVDLDNMCEREFDNFGPGAAIVKARCRHLGRVYLDAFTIGGQPSWVAAQVEACMCGPNSDCQGAQPRRCPNCPREQQQFRNDIIIIPGQDPCPGGC